jgi:hypothetical protein
MKTRTSITSYEKKLIAAFKSFVLEEKNLKLDFRTHVYLENHYGGYPSYGYSDAEAVIDCMFEFFDKYHVDYSGRYNHSSIIDSLRTGTLSHFLSVTLAQEIKEVVFNAVNSEDITTVITSIGIFYDDDDTVEVTAISAIGESETFHVQTTDGLHRQDLNCWMTAPYGDGDGHDIHGDDYPFFDLGLIVEKAEQLVQNSYEIKWTKCSGLYLKVYSDKVQIVEENRNFINEHHSSGETEYSLVETFTDESDANKYIAELNNN